MMPRICALQSFLSKSFSLFSCIDSSRLMNFMLIMPRFYKNILSYLIAKNNYISFKLKIFSHASRAPAKEKKKPPRLRCEGGRRRREAATRHASRWLATKSGYVSMNHIGSWKIRENIRFMPC